MAYDSRIEMEVSGGGWDYSFTINKIRILMQTDNEEMQKLTGLCKAFMEWHAPRFA